MTPVIAIPVNADTATRAEFMLDWIFQLSGRTQKGHTLLVFDADVSPEMRAKIKITADLAFLSVDELLVPSKDTAGKTASPTVKRNALFLAAAEYCQKTYRLPWLWLPGDSTPTNPDWLENIAAAYDAQPRRYLCTHLKPSEDSKDRYPFQCSVWHMGTWNDVNPHTANPEIPCEVAAGMFIVSRSTKCRLFQPLRIFDEGDFEKVWPEAQIVVGDSTGALIERYRELGVHLPKQPLAFPGELSSEALAARDNPLTAADFGGRMPIAVPINHAPLLPPLAKIDLRTKAGRALKAARMAEKAA